MKSSFVPFFMALTIATAQQFLPFGLGAYQHDISFPGLTGEFHTSTVDGAHQPIRQISGSFKLTPPPPALPIFQGFPLEPQFASNRNSYRRNHPGPGFFTNGPLRKLFTPVTSRERPESEGQYEEYQKSLKEEAEQREKEILENEITTDFTDFLDTTTSVQANPNNAYVRVNIQGKDYSYST